MPDQESITQVRDILISVYLVVGILLTLALLVLACVLVKAVRRVLNAVTNAVETANGTLENVNKASESVLRFVTSPEGERNSASFANGLGMLVGFIAGMRGKAR